MADGGQRARKVHLPVWISPEESDRFLKGDWKPYAAEIEDLAHKGIQTTDLALFTYGMFVEWDSAHETTYKDFARALPAYRGAYDRYFDVDDGEIRFRRDPRVEFVERIGVGAALATTAKVVGLTDADFEIIPVQKVKALDFRHQIHAFGNTFELEVEAKGTHDGKGSSKHRGEIRDKKAVQARRGRRSHRVLRIGVIADIATDPSKTSSVELVDPPGDGQDEDLSSERFLRRLDFYRSRLALVTPRGRMVAALANRIAVLKSMSPARRAELDDVPLVGGSMEPLKGRPLPGTELALLGPRTRRAQVKLSPLGATAAAGNDSVSCYVHGIVSSVVQRLTTPAMSDVLDLRETEATVEVRDNGIYGQVAVLPSGLVGGLVSVKRWRLRIPDEDVAQASTFLRR